MSSMGGKEVEPNLATLSHSLLGVDQGNGIVKSLLEDLDELAGEGDFRNKENGRFTLSESICGELEVNICLAAASNAAEEASRARGLNKLV